MPFIQAINYCLANILLGLLIFGIITNVMHAEKTPHRRALIATLSYWAIMFAGTIYAFNTAGLQLGYNQDIVSIQMLVLGIPSFISVLAYPAFAIHPRLLKVKSWGKIGLSLVFTPMIYFAWHIINGTDPFIRYTTMAEFMQNITTVPVILRLLIMFVFLTYIIFTLMTLWRIVPLYNKFITDNVADNSYNVEWIRTLIIYLSCVSVSYFTMLFTNSKIINLAYLLSITALFGYIINRSLFAKTFEDIEPLDIRWTRKLGWHVANSLQEEASTKTERVCLETMEGLIDQWMDEMKSYTKVDFTTNDILVAFPDLIHEDLTLLFKNKGESFQSYVRRYRIALACEIIKQSEDKVYPKQVYSMVGFSHYSSFSRSFVSVTGMSPSDYIKNKQSS